MAAISPSATNVFVPNFEASGRLHVDFSRNPKSFKLNEYIQIVPVKQSRVKYLRHTVAEAGRVMNTNGADFMWADGADAPRRNEGLESFEWFDGETERYIYGAPIGDKARDQAEWDIVGHTSRVYAQQCMTDRTLQACTMLTTTGNYPSSSYYSAVGSISGNTGTWAASTTARQDIRRSIQHANRIIHQGTLGAVSLEDMVLVMGPTAAGRIAESQEIVDYLKASVHSLPYMTGKAEWINQKWGLPDTYAGVKIVVEDAVRVTSHKNATDARGYVLSDSAFMVARPGQLEGTEGPTFSTATMFAYEDMTVETLTDVNNRRTDVRIVDDRGFEMTAPTTGFLFTTVYS